MSFTCFFLGLEQSSLRRKLLDAGVKNGGFSYWSVRNRLSKKKPVLLGEWGFERIFLDSGGYSANKDPSKHTAREWAEYGTAYADFAMDHLDDLEMISEFDCLALGPAWIEKMRQDVWSKIPVEKFLPIWHPEHGVRSLEELGERYKRIGITQDHLAQPGLNVTPHLNKLANNGVQLHGLAMGRPDAVRHVRFASVSSTAWLSGARFGESQIWDGARLIRYPASMKSQARTRHQRDFERAGMDAAKIQADDTHEVTRMALWSWLQYEKSLQGVTAPAASIDVETPDYDEDEVDRADLPVRKTRATPKPRPVEFLPVFGFTEQQAVDTDSNEMTTYHLPVLNSAPLRQCNTCFVRAECPAFEEDASCKFHMPIEVKTPAQRKALMNALVEMQAQRVAFMRFREELSGGYADPSLSQEYDRLIKTFQVLAEIEDEREFFRMNVEARGKSGVLSRLFGKEAAALTDTGPKLDAIDTDRLVGRVIKGTAE